MPGAGLSIFEQPETGSQRDFTTDLQAAMAVGAPAVSSRVARKQGQAARGIGAVAPQRMIFLRNLLRAPARSLMTVLGLGVGLGLFLGIAAIATDLNQQIAGTAAAYSLEVVVHERRTTSPISSRISPAQMARLQERLGPGVMPLVIGTLKERWNPYALIIGAPDAFVRRTPMTAGVHPASAREVALGEIAAQRMGLGPGATLTLDAHELTVSGIFRTGSRMLDGGVMTGIEQAQVALKRPEDEPFFSMALVQTGGQIAVDDVIRRVDAEFPQLRALRGTEFSGSLRLMRVVEAFVTTISVIALIGTGLILANTLVMALSERTREIGILMAIGWTPWLILRMLMAESLVLCLAGSAVGIGFALLLLRVLNRIEAIGFGWIPIGFEPLLALQATLMALAIGVLALLWPAVVVFRMQPLAALRHE